MKVRYTLSEQLVKKYTGEDILNAAQIVCEHKHIEFRETSALRTLRNSTHKVTLVELNDEVEIIVKFMKFSAHRFKIAA